MKRLLCSGLLILFFLHPALPEWVLGGASRISFGVAAPDWDTQEGRLEHFFSPEFSTARFTMSLARFGSWYEFRAVPEAALTSYNDPVLDIYELMFRAYLLGGAADLTIGRTTWQEGPALFFRITDPLHTVSASELFFGGDPERELTQNMIQARYVFANGYIRAVAVPFFRAEPLPDPQGPFFPQTLIPQEFHFAGRTYTPHEISIIQNPDAPAGLEPVPDFGFDAGFFWPAFDLRLMGFWGWERNTVFSGAITLNNNPYRTYSVDLFPERSRVVVAGASLQGRRENLEWWVETAGTWNSAYGAEELELKSGNGILTEAYRGDRAGLTAGLLYQPHHLPLPVQLVLEWHGSRVFQVRATDQKRIDDPADWNIQRPMLANAVAGAAETRLFQDKLSAALYGAYDIGEQAWGLLAQLNWEPELFGPALFSVSYPWFFGGAGSLWAELPSYLTIAARYRW